jgi:HK97 family phage major capsid protein
MSWGKIEGSASISESTQSPSTGYIYVEDLYGLTKIGEDELADTDLNLQAIIADSFSRARADEEEEMFTTGRGHTTYEEPEGIAVDSTLQTSIGSGAGAGANGTYGINWDTDDTLTAEEIIEAYYRLGKQYRKNASWLMNSKTEMVLRQKRAGGYTATDGPWLWEPSLQAGSPNVILGRPCFNNESMKYPADTTAGINIIFGDFKTGYRIVDRMAMSMKRLDELYIESGLIGFMAHFRVGGSLVLPAAFQVICNDT